MSLSDLFGDLGDEDDEEDYRPDSNQISDIEDDEEMDTVSHNNTHSDQPRGFSLGDELLKPMKPPEFDSDDEMPSGRGHDKRPVLSSDDDVQTASDIRQLNNNLFGSDNESDEEDTARGPTSEDQVQDADDFFKDSDNEDKITKPSSSKTTAADLFGSDIDDDSDADKLPDPLAQALQSSGPEAATQQDIFGSDLSMSDEEHAAKKVTTVSSPKSPGSPVKGLGSDEDVPIKAQGSEGESDDDKDEESELTVELPLTDINLGENLNLIKLPNFISLDTRPFDPETYEDEIEDDQEITDDEGRARLKLKVENTIRWRHSLNEQGNLIKQSNSKIVKWSDGSISLFVGSEEFDILEAPLTGANSHLYVKHGSGILGQAQFQKKMMFRIHSTDSYTHRKLTMRISDRVSKASKTKTTPAIGKNPQIRREEICRKEEERQAAARRRENMQKKLREKNMSKPMSTRYLEPDDEEGESLAAIKNSYKGGKKAKETKKKKAGQRKVSDVYSSEEEEEEEEPLLSEDEEDEAAATDSDSETDRRKPKKKTAIIEDEEESD